MAEFKGTKGKWVHMEFPEGQNSVRTVDGNRKICVPRVHNRDESDANMQLISKAPEMLEMLEMLVKEFDVEFTNQYQFDLHSKAKQLIKEATEIK